MFLVNNILFWITHICLIELYTYTVLSLNLDKKISMTYTRIIDGGSDVCLLTKSVPQPIEFHDGLLRCSWYYGEVE